MCSNRFMNCYSNHLSTMKINLISAMRHRVIRLSQPKYVSNDKPTDKNNLRTTFERAEVIGQWIGEIERNVETIKQMICRLDDISLNLIDINTKIDNYFQNNTSISHRINGKLKELEEELSTVNNETAEGRIKSIQYNTLKSRYIQIFKINNAELERYRNIQKDRLEAQLKAKGVSVTDEELVALLDKKVDIQVFTENIIFETAEAKRTLADIEERHQRLLKIERMLVEVRDMFLQIAILVDAQQDLVDRVEWQAQVAKEYVGRTPKILSDAAKKKRSYLKCKIITIASVVTVVILVVIMLLN